ncbi:MAG: hypothetical protein A2Y40_10360 [Candidatus Margulisbacteria bacterium GWF2_35_9]|nr:MAG: hypothetical protein A2Y40_10360 [Candidatus Margulisbacteria bacterium GWF2_35_9]
MTTKYDIAIIGCGTAGYDAAIAASKTGLSVIIFEDKYIGGTCLNVGCIPTKAYLYKAKQYQMLQKFQMETALIDSLNLSAINASTKRIISRSQRAMENNLKAQNINVINESVSYFDSVTITTLSGNNFCFDKLILASGSAPFIPPSFHHLMSNPRVYTNETIFTLEAFPPSVTIIGGGVIGIEFAFFFSSFGISVDVIELAPSILSNTDAELIQEARKLLKRKKVKFHEGIQITEIGDDLSIILSDGTNINNEIMVIATGRKANIPAHSIDLKLTTKGFVETNDCYQTTFKNIFAIGDINGKSLLAHSASNQADQLIQYIMDETIPNKKSIPSVIYINPSLSSVGITEKEAKSHYKVTKIPYGLSGKAQAEENTEGWIKLITENKTLLGCHIFGVNGEDLLPICILAIDQKLNIEDLANTIYAHPSYCELLKVAFHAALD